MASPILNVNVIADTKKFSSGMRAAIGDTDDLSAGLKRFGIAAGVAAAAATAALTAFSVSAVKAASDLNETVAAVGQVFGDSSKELEAFAKQAPTLLGQTQNAFLNAAKTFGIFGKAAGLAGQENVDFSKKLAILASDLASFNNTSVDDAITALGAALRGESEPIRKYGVLLDDATLKARALEMGIYDGNGVLTQQQRVLAANAEIFAQTITQQGDFARTSDGLANSIKVLTAQFDALKIKLGEELYPVATALVPELTKFVEALTASPEFDAFVKGLADTFQALLIVLLPLLDVFFDLFVAVMPPLMKIIEALAPIVGKLVDAFMPLIDAILPLLVELISLAVPFIEIFVDLITPLVPVIVDLVKAFAPLVREILPLLTQLVALLVPAIQGLAVSMKVIIRDAIGPFAAVLGEIVGFIGQLFGFSGKSISAPGLTANRPKLAEGGIVMPRPGGVPVTVAEAGQAEAIIPLDKLGSLGGGMKVTINGNVGWSPEDMANIILKKQKQAMALAGLNGIVGVR